MGIAKRIVGARMAGLYVPQAVLALVGAAKAAEPPAPRTSKAALAARVAPPAADPVETAPVPQPKFDPPPQEPRPPATVQRESSLEELVGLRVRNDLRILRALQHRGNATRFELQGRVQLSEADSAHALASVMEVNLVGLLDGKYHLTRDGVDFVTMALPEPPVECAVKRPEGPKQGRLF